ncbi:MAG: hypothetical protein M5R36_11735 [Deltaproteobacteria bacterium]|nr:hypothetical protein [Deltaproteobacteria bacterium]
MIHAEPLAPADAEALADLAVDRILRPRRPDADLEGFRPVLAGALEGMRVVSRSAGLKSSRRRRPSERKIELLQYS